MKGVFAMASQKKRKSRRAKKTSVKKEPTNTSVTPIQEYVDSTAISNCEGDMLTADEKPFVPPVEFSKSPKPQFVDLRQFIYTGEENKAQMPKVEERERPITVVNQVEHKKTEEIPEKWSLTSSVKLPGGIEIAHVIFESKVNGRRQIIIAMNDGKVAAINTLRIGD